MPSLVTRELLGACVEELEFVLEFKLEPAKRRPASFGMTPELDVVVFVLLEERYASKLDCTSRPESSARAEAAVDEEVEEERGVIITCGLPGDSPTIITDVSFELDSTL